MTYHLGIDLGTASIAITQITPSSSAQPPSRFDASVLIFSEPVEPTKQGGVGAPKKAARREKRAMRRLIARRGHDMRWIRRLYAPMGIEESDLADNVVFRSNAVCNIHELRAKAAREPVTVPALIRVLGKMKKRRGYKGRFRETNRPGEVQAGIQTVETEMHKHGCKTLGEYLLWRHRHDLTLKLKEADPKLYVHRQMVEDEFEQIWRKQSGHHEQLQGKHDSKLWKHWFHDYVFYQRPLRSPAPMVGHCELDPTLPRAPRAQPLFQRFRIRKTLADLAWSDGTPLPEAAKAMIDAMLSDSEHLNANGVLTFEKIYGTLHKKGLLPEEGTTLNLHTTGRQGLKGDTTRKALYKMGLLEEWDELDEHAQLQIINLLADMGSPEVFEDPNWEKNLRTPSGNQRKLRQETVAFINRMVESPRFARLAAMGMDAGRAEYSLKTLRRLLELMAQGMNEHEAKDAGWPGWDKAGDSATHHFLAPHPATGNVSVDCALANLRREINRLIERHGPPDSIIVEMTRDMRLGYRKRNEIAKHIAHNEEQRRQAAKALEDAGYPATSRNLFGYLLWEEQDKRWCPFCTEAINLEAAMDGNQTNVEHIIPFRLSRVGRQRSKLVLAHRKCNDEKGMRTPWQAWGGNEERWAVIEKRAKAFEKKKSCGKARQLLLKDFDDEVLTDEVIEDFTNRQYHESGWIAKLAAQWLKSICPDVAVTRGQLTAHLRRIWGLDTVIPEVRFDEGLPVLDEAGKPLAPEDLHNPQVKPDKRIDHRHHLVDAVVIALSTRSLFNRMARHYKQVSELADEGKKGKLRLDVEPPIPDLRDRVKERVRACPVRHKPDRYPDGQIFEDTAYRLVEIEKDGERVTVLASRKLLKDVTDGNATPKKLRDFVKGIVYPETRRVIEDAVKERLAAGVKPAKVFDEPILHPVYRKPIRRVFRASNKQGGYETVFVRKDVDEHMRARSPNAWRKHLKHAGNAYLEIDQTNKTVRLVSVLEAMREKGRPAPDGVLRIYKGDTILHPNGKRHVVRQIKSRNDGTLVCTLLSEARPVNELNKQSGLVSVSGINLMKIELVNE